MAHGKYPSATGSWFSRRLDHCSVRMYATAASHQEGNGENGDTRPCSRHPFGSGRNAQYVDNGVSIVHKEILLSVVSWFVANATWGCDKDMYFIKFELLPSPTASTGLSGRLRACRKRRKCFKEFFSAEVIRLPIAFGMEGCLFVHDHAANGVFCGRFGICHGHVSRWFLVYL